REGSDTYGTVVHQEIGPDKAVFVPRGVANGFQALEENTTYSYLVSDHWSPDAHYTAVNLDMIPWPLTPTEISDKDRNHPQLDDVTPMPPRKILVTGANGQLGKALREVYRNAAHVEFLTHQEFDITASDISSARPWRQYQAIINCAAYNDVNGAEYDRASAWETNATAPARLAKIAADNNLTIVNTSSMAVTKFTPKKKSPLPFRPTEHLKLPVIPPRRLRRGTTLSAPRGSLVKAITSCQRWHR